jgi:transcriptional regulator with XRE-family HTH domain
MRPVNREENLVVAKSNSGGEPPAYGRGTGVPDPVDVHVGARIRTLRLLLDMNQDALATALGLTFQQVQKYESGANRVSASRLFEIAEVLGVTPEYFFSGLPFDGDSEPSSEDQQLREMMQRPEMIDLVRVYYGILDSLLRRQVLEMARMTASSQRSPG